ncbi:hypothetical protein AN644_00770 [Candidatus Epulonipiscium fishelsonii]|nr:hypothetical protein AN644_00770 [Epulopiscium sp. SCG-C06WGA-EpuloA1]
MIELSEIKMVQMLDWIYQQSNPSARKLAEEYSNKYAQKEIAIDKLIFAQTTKCSANGFITGLGGIATCAISIPANISSVLYMQLTMIKAIAILREYDLEDDEVKSLVYVSLLGTGASNFLLKEVGIEIGKKMATNFIKTKIKGYTLTKINRAVGFRLVTKFGEKGVINLGKLVPVAGGGIAATMDAVSAIAVAKASKNIFCIKVDDYNLTDDSY